MFAYPLGMQLRLDAADRLVELVEERRGPVFVGGGCASAVRAPPRPGRDGAQPARGGRRRRRSPGLARRRRRARRPARRGPAARARDLRRRRPRDDRAATGHVAHLRDRRGARARARARGRLRAARRSRRSRRAGDHRRSPDCATPICAVPRIPRSRCAVFSSSRATRCSSRTTRASTSRFSTARPSGWPAPASPVRSSTRSDLRGGCSRVGQPRAGLASLAQFFGTAAQPCHRALPDAQATAEILIQLIGLAQERGALTVADLVDLAAPRVRKVYAKRSLAFGAPTAPGVYLFRDAHDQVLYVGRARDLRARLRSYFRSDRQRPAVEAALSALDRIEWRVCGSELEAALEELRLLRELRPPANARNARPDRYVYLRRRGDSVVCSTKPSPVGPLKSRTRARLAARALRADEAERPELALPRLRARLRDLSECRRFEDAARLRDRLSAVEDVVRTVQRLERLRRTRCCLVVPCRARPATPAVCSSRTGGSRTCGRSRARSRSKPASPRARARPTSISRQRRSTSCC